MSENTPCIRCGKIRILEKKWVEKVGLSTITYTKTVCPDGECQKIVDDELQKKAEKLLSMQKRSQERMKLLQRKKRVKST